jgi:hypothetical protein
LFVTTMACLLVSGTAVARTWTDAGGSHQVEARFITFQFGKVWLLRSDGRMFSIEPEGLSAADQEHVRELIRQREANAKTTQNPAGRVAYGPGRVLCRLQNEEIAESSGLACSRRLPGYFWTHNDSGGDARVYLFDEKGRNLGSCELEDILAFDCEDMFSYRENGRDYLVLCDVGNNGRSAGTHMLHVIEEPPFDAQQGVQVDRTPVLQTIYLAYEDDHRNCEAVGMDPSSRTMLFVTRERESECYVYALAWPESREEKAAVARRIAILKLPPVTAMDVSPDGRRAVVLTYGNAFEFVRGENEDWRQAFSRQPREIVVPERVQGESICYGSDGKTLYLTSENLPTPLLMVPVLK